jgi:hypothetical protein
MAEFVDGYFQVLNNAAQRFSFEGIAGVHGDDDSGSVLRTDVNGMAPLWRRNTKPSL